MAIVMTNMEAMRMVIERERERRIPGDDGCSVVEATGLGCIMAYCHCAGRLPTWHNHTRQPTHMSVASHMYNALNLTTST
jgi:hypothetical protein